MKIDQEALKQLQEQGLISIQRHPELPLLIHNYSQRCQWEKAWNEHTLMCRGLITDLDGNVVCRPFPKFFNLGEHASPESTLPPINWRQEFYVSEKMDGSLGIAYPVPGGYQIATRGSFVSEQATRGTAMLERLNPCFSPGHTYLFEIIFPENRIVVDYGKQECLVLLDVIDNETGIGLPRRALEIEADAIGCRITRHHRHQMADHLLNYSSDEPNREGVVVRFEDGMRIKIKFAEYCRLHKLVTGVNSKTIWEMLRDGKSLSELLDRVPDEFFEWVSKTAEELLREFHEILRVTTDIFDAIKEELGDAARKEYAERFKGMPRLTPLLFLMLDGRDCTPSIWKMLKPESAVAFATADE